MEKVLRTKKKKIIMVKRDHLARLESEEEEKKYQTYSECKHLNVSEMKKDRERVNEYGILVYSVYALDARFISGVQQKSICFFILHFTLSSENYHLECAFKT